MNCTSMSVANPDIDGIGIRISMYAQAVLALLPIGIALLAGDRNDIDFQAGLANDIKLNATAVLATGCALLVASFIQAARKSLDLYDAIIVLQLSWLNNLTAAFPTLLRTVLEEDTSVRKDGFFWRKLGLYMLHCTATGIFGLFVFANIKSWTPGCADNYYVIFAGQRLQASGPNLKIAFIVVSSLAAVPLLNALGIFLIIFVLFNIEQVLCSFRENHTPTLALLAWTVPSLMCIVSTEQFISQNSGAISGAADQSDWSFGQILALILVIFPLWTAVDRITTLYRNRPGQQPIPLRDEEEGRQPLMTTPPQGATPMGSRLPSYSEASGQRYSQVSGTPS